MSVHVVNIIVLYFVFRVGFEPENFSHDIIILKLMITFIMVLTTLYSAVTSDYGNDN